MVKLRIIPFNQNHINPIWIWRNDIRTIEMSLSKKKVTWQEHFEWCNSIITSKSNHMYVAEEFGIPVGVVRFDENKDKKCVFDLTINLDPNKRNKGYGSKILRDSINFFINEINKCKYIRAQIRVSNFPSIKLFEKYGFKKISSDSEFKEYIFEIN